MNIFPIPFSIANEVVKRTKNDNRRLKAHRKDGGNNLFYLGVPEQFINKFQDPLRTKLIEVHNLCKERLKDKTIHPQTLQKGQGIKVMNIINKQSLLSLIPFIDAFLKQYSDLYHNPNFELENVIQKFNKINTEDLSFYSDLVFISDKKQAKPYLKWFNYHDTEDVFELVREFLIPHLSFLNFEFESFTDNIITFRWDLSYTVTVLYSSDNVEEILSKSIEKLHIPQDEINTIKEAIAKIRIGQSKFRTDLLKSNRNSCAFTEIFDDKLLIASHIKPWSVSNNDERLDENNGILLTPMFDKLFDKFLITFDEDGKLIWTQSRLDKLTKEKIIKGCIVDLNKFKMTINQSNNEYFNYHRLEFKKREKEN